MTVILVTLFFIIMILVELARSEASIASHTIRYRKLQIRRGSDDRTCPIGSQFAWNSSRENRPLSLRVGGTPDQSPFGLEGEAE
jgi:hypothetical protein